MDRSRLPRLYAAMLVGVTCPGLATSVCMCVLSQVRLFFLLSWFHAVVTERLRYVPLGWSHKYEFSQADAQSAFDVIEEWVNKVSQCCSQHIDQTPTGRA